MSNISRQINRLFAKEDWAQARKIIEGELRKAPDSHWLHDRLSVTYYEKRDYAHALEHVEKAYEIMPTCPLVLWDYAGTLDALKRSREAISYYLRIFDLFAKHADHECWESEKRSASLSLDCFFRIGVCYTKLGKYEIAKASLAAFCRLQHKSNLSQLYTIEQARKLMYEVDDAIYGTDDATDSQESIRLEAGKFKQLAASY